MRGSIPLRNLPQVDIARYNAASVPIRDEWMYPEALQRQSLRANLNTTLSPTFDLNPFRVNGQLQDDGKTIKLWAEDHEGWLTMDAVATLRAGS